MDLAGVIGILGFCLTLAIVLLTRWERRRQLAVEFFTDHDKLFRDERGDDDEHPVLVARIINTGGKQVLIDRNSFVFIGNGRPVEWYKTDFFGRENLPSSLNPGDKTEIGMYVESFAGLLDAGSEDRLALALELKDTSAPVAQTF